MKQEMTLIARIAQYLPEMSSEKMQAWIESPKELQKFLAGLARGPQMLIEVNYDLSVTDAIVAGHYDWHNENITAERFPHQGTGKVELVPELVHFDRNINTENAIAELKTRGLRPATLMELLALGAQHPELQRKFPIVALGQSTKLRGNRRAPFLYEDGGRRLLRLYYAEFDWDPNYRFLAFAI